MLLFVVEWLCVVVVRCSLLCVVDVCWRVLFVVCFSGLWLSCFCFCVCCSLCGVVRWLLIVCAVCRLLSCVVYCVLCVVCGVRVVSCWM